MKWARFQHKYNEGALQADHSNKMATLSVWGKDFLTSTKTKFWKITPPHPPLHILYPLDKLVKEKELEWREKEPSILWRC